MTICDPHFPASHFNFIPCSLLAATKANMRVPRTWLPTGVAPRIPSNLVPSSPRAALVARRLISSTAPARAEPIHHHDPLMSDLEAKVHRKKHEHPHLFDAKGNEINPYKGGPSAIDKAVHLFFFTEIIRGRLHFRKLARKFTYIGLRCRHVGRSGTILPGTIHYHVPVRERPAFSPIPWRACAQAIPQRRRTVHWFVLLSVAQHQLIGA